MFLQSVAIQLYGDSYSIFTRKVMNGAVECIRLHVLSLIYIKSSIVKASLEVKFQPELHYEYHAQRQSDLVSIMYVYWLLVQCHCARNAFSKWYNNVIIFRMQAVFKLRMFCNIEQFGHEVLIVLCATSEK
jgi:hypothetical protein